MESPGRRASFEEAYHSLEDVVGSLEQGGLSLEDALASFERGMRLAGECMRLLDDAELRVTRLLADDGLLGEPDGREQESAED